MSMLGSGAVQTSWKQGGLSLERGFEVSAALAETVDALQAKLFEGAVWRREGALLRTTRASTSFWMVLRRAHGPLMAHCVPKIVWDISNLTEHQRKVPRFPRRVHKWDF
jgi:hypothetical protein